MSDSFSQSKLCPPFRSVSFRKRFKRSVDQETKPIEFSVKDAEMVLKTCAEGTYLLYTDYFTEKLYLSVRTNDEISHHKVIQQDGLFYIDRQPYPYLDSIIFYHRKHKLKGTKLTQQAHISHKTPRSFPSRYTEPNGNIPLDDASPFHDKHFKAGRLPYYTNFTPEVSDSRTPPVSPTKRSKSLKNKNRIPSRSESVVLVKNSDYPVVREFRQTSPVHTNAVRPKSNGYSISPRADITPRVSEAAKKVKKQNQSKSTNAEKVTATHTPQIIYSERL